MKPPRKWVLCKPKYQKFENKFGPILQYEFINVTMPHLEHIEIDPSREDTHRSREQIKDVLRKNPQIRSFSIGNGYWFANGYMRMVEDLLPNIEDFTVSQVDSDEPIYLEKLKNFHVNGDGIPIDRLANLTFPSLEWLDLNFDIHHSDRSTIGWT